MSGKLLFCCLSFILSFREDYEYDMECRRIDDMMDRYRLTDPYLEVRRLEDLRERQRSLREFENKRLDELMARQRLQDPLLESTRFEDILRRKQKIEEMGRARLEDIMRRKRLLEENDVEKLRLERYIYLTRAYLKKKCLLWNVFIGTV